MNRLLTTVAAAALLALPAIAQTSNPNSSAAQQPGAASGATTAPAAGNAAQENPASKAAGDTTKPAGSTAQDTKSSPDAKAKQSTAQELNPSDRNFINTAAGAGMAVVEAGKLAGTKARSSAVKNFAKHMVTDHSKANDQLMKLAKQLNTAPAKDMDAENKASIQKLSGLSGAAFDKAYMEEQLQAHQKAVQLFQRQASAGQNAELKKFAADTLPKLQEHLQSAQKVAAAETSRSTASSESPAARTPMGNNPAGATGMMSTGEDSGAATKPKRQSRATTSDESGTAPSGKRASASQDPEHGRIVELNQRELQRIQSGQQSR